MVFSSRAGRNRQQIRKFFPSQRARPSFGLDADARRQQRRA
jgi:hypothetical protein